MTVPNLLSLHEFEAFVLSLPAVTLVHQWGDASVAKVGGRIFALLSGRQSDGQAALSFKCSDVSYQMLPSLEQVRPAPYLARAKWVQVLDGAPLDGAAQRAYVTEAHRIVASKLTRKARADLGLDQSGRTANARSGPGLGTSASQGGS